MHNVPLNPEVRNNSQDCDWHPASRTGYSDAVAIHPEPSPIAGPPKNPQGSPLTCNKEGRLPAAHF